jgi:hypothetical protein
MIQICCSKHHIGDRKFGEKEPLENKNETHGLCDVCFPIEMKEIKESLKRLRAAGWPRYGDSNQS